MAGAKFSIKNREKARARNIKPAISMNYGKIFTKPFKI